MERRYEFYLKSKLSGEIYCQLWKSSFSISSGTVLITHGLSEHSDNYHEFSKVLNSWGLDVLAWDLIGHGRSSGKRGFVRNFDDLLIHQKQVIEWGLKNAFLGFNDQGLESVKPKEVHQLESVKRNKKAFILFSHSLGGLISIKNLLTHQDLGVDALLLSSPCLGLSLKVSKFKLWFAKLANRFFPRLTLNNEVSYEALSRDQGMIKSYLSDPLRHDRISAPLFLGMIESMKFVKKRAHTFHWPILFQVSKKDQIVNSKETLIFYHKVNSSLKKFIHYPKSYHEIYNDLDKAEALRDLRGFLSRFFEFKKEELDL